MAKTEPSTDPQPASRVALRIVPDMDRLEVQALEDFFGRLHSFDPELNLEFGILARDGTVEYYVAADSTYASTIEHTLRRVFPQETSIDREPISSTAVPDTPTAALECHGWGDRRLDWQTRRTPVLRNEDALQLPLASVVDTLADADATVVYQTVLTPKPDWRGDAEFRIDARLYFVRQVSTI